MRRIFTVLMMVLMMVPSLVFPQDITITLDQGWTWISYPRGDTLQLDYALSVITPNQGDIIKSQQTFSIYDTEDGWQGSLSEFIPGKGYMYKSSQEESFSFVFPDPVVPVVTTGEVSGITTTSATCGGNVVSSGGKYITARGLCWSMNENPTIANDHTTDGNGLGEYVGTMEGLLPNTTYYVRAYATNSQGTGYGEQVSFTTSNWHNGGIDGALPKWFTINADGDEILFSQGNLQYQASTNTWKFAEHQYDMIGNANSNISSTYTGWIDLFGWGTSGYNHGSAYYQPWSTSRSNSDYYAYGSYTNNLYDGNGMADWGYNAISNGGNQENQWRTLTQPEWNYVINTRSTASGIRYAKAQVNNVIGVILLPNDWSRSIYTLNDTNSSIAAYTSNVVDSSTWQSVFEANGAVFLPAAGYRSGTSIDDLNYAGNYWSSSIYSSSQLFFLCFYGRNLSANFIDDRYEGRTVRLVHDVEITITVTTSSVTNITQTTASCGGDVTADEGIDITTRGVCWSTSLHPTIEANHTSDGSGTGSFTSDITGLTANTTYYVRAYATTSNGTKYGNEFSFTTESASVLPEGALPGQFTINSNNDKVYFSQGNLQYQASSNTWRFAENQWDFVGSTTVSSGNPGGTVSGSSNHLISSTYSGWIDLFGWGTSGNNHGANCYQPWSTSLSHSDYYAYGSYQNNLCSGNGMADWGYNAINNGGNQVNQWRTMTIEEWTYVLNSRSTPSGIRYAKAQVNGVNGVILLPDDWNAETCVLNNTNNNEAAYNSNLVNDSVWIESFEANGAVFLPSAGYRSMTAIRLVGSYGVYWSSSYNDNDRAYSIRIDVNVLDIDYNGWRAHGHSVRLVHDIETLPTITVTTSSVTNITQTTATCGGDVTADEGIVITDRGICWSTSLHPTIEDNHISCGTGLGSFISDLTGLTANITYYVRAYATTSDGAEYGNEISFTTESASVLPEGALPGQFTINSNNDKVYFSQGNLQYKGSASTPYWKFAENQWDVLGNNGQGSTNQTVDRDLFGWGTSGYHDSNDPYNTQYQPWSTSTSQVNSNYNYYGYGPSTNRPSPNLTGSSANYDWGIYNPISNGGGTAGQWRTLTKDEWVYVFNTRSTTSGVRYARAQVNNVNGLILLPDDWSSSYYTLNNTNSGGAAFTSNRIDNSTWQSVFEANGAVFLPAAGRRSGTSVLDVNTNGIYWSTSYISSNYAYYVDFFISGLSAGWNGSRYTGFSVRLVRENATLPTLMVTTSSVTNITQTTATCGGDVTADEGIDITAHGVCWSTNQNPTIEDSHTSDGTGAGSYTSDITGLTANTTYYVRAYATTSYGVEYGNEVSFTTESASSFPEGALVGQFSINSSNGKVYFSQGNLQYQASTNTWRFAENQYDMIGSANSNISSSYTGWIDLFGWGTSGYNHGAVCYQPWSSSTYYSYYYAYGSWENNLNSSDGTADWGYNAISNGGNQENLWRTLTRYEWEYVLYSRHTMSGIRYAKALVNNVNGLILLPDNWSSTLYTLNNANSSESVFTSNMLDYSTWQTIFEANGAVFLPTSGYRDGTTVSRINSDGYYWSSTYSNNTRSYSMDFDSSNLEIDNIYYGRNRGQSVRLVQDCE